MFATYESAHPELAADFRRRMAGELPQDFAARVEAMVHETDLGRVKQLLPNH